MTKPIRQAIKDTYKAVVASQSEIDNRYRKNIFDVLEREANNIFTSLDTVDKYHSSKGMKDDITDDIITHYLPLAIGKTEDQLTYDLGPVTADALESSWDVAKELTLTIAKVNDTYVRALKAVAESLLQAATNGDLFGDDLTKSIAALNTLTIKPVGDTNDDDPDLTAYKVKPLTPTLIGYNQVHLYPTTILKVEDTEDEVTNNLTKDLYSPLVRVRPSKHLEVGLIKSPDSPDTLDNDTLTRLISVAKYVANQIHEIIPKFRDGFTKDMRNYNDIIEIIQQMVVTEIDLRGKDGEQFRKLHHALGGAITTGMLHQYLAVTTIYKRLLEASKGVAEIAKVAYGNTELESETQEEPVTGSDLDAEVTEDPESTSPDDDDDVLDT